MIANKAFNKCTGINAITVPALFDIKQLRAAMQGTGARDRAEVTREALVLSAQKSERMIPGSFAMAFLSFVLLCSERLKRLECLKSNRLPALPNELWMMILDYFHHIYIPEKTAKLGSNSLLFSKKERKILTILE